MLSDPTRRALRTFCQVGLAAVLVNLYNAFAPHPLTPEQQSAMLAALTVLLTLAQNLLEEGNYVPKLLKGPPPAPPVPAVPPISPGAPGAP